jgi:hypothetical protein
MALGADFGKLSELLSEDQILPLAFRAVFLYNSGNPAGAGER